MNAKSMESFNVCQLEQVENKIPAGLPSLGKIIKGWHLSDLVIISSQLRKGGRTLLAMSIARNLTVDYRIPVAYFSLKLPTALLGKRLIEMETGHTIKTLDDKTRQDMAKLMEAPLFIDDTPELSIFDLREKVKRLTNEHGIKLVIVDYVQLMGGYEGTGSRDCWLENVVKTLKDIASEFGVVVMALDKMYRPANDMVNTRDFPKVAGAEKYADVMLEYCPNKPERSGSLDWDAEIVVIKNNKGDVGSCFVKVTNKYRLHDANTYHD